MTVQHGRMVAAGLVAGLGGSALVGPIACTGVEPAAVGAGATVVQSAVTIFDKGKARIVEDIGREEALELIRRVGEALSLKLEGEREYPLSTLVDYRDDHHAPITVTVERRTQTMTMVQVDVGLFGEIGIATAVLRKFQDDLRERRPRKPDAASESADP